LKELFTFEGAEKREKKAEWSEQKILHTYLEDDGTKKTVSKRKSLKHL